MNAESGGGVMRVAGRNGFLLNMLLMTWWGQAVIVATPAETMSITSTDPMADSGGKAIE
jgi:hypothetical protein